MEAENLLAYLEGLESTRGTIEELSSRPDLQPPLILEMATGEYRVTWVDDAGGGVIDTQRISTGVHVRRARFQKHIAIAVPPADQRRVITFS